MRAPESVIEEACQFAWSRFVHRAGRVRREAALSWLVTTAVREAYKLLRREARSVSLEAVLEDTGDRCLGASSPAPEQVISDRQRLELIAVLPERQQRLLWLQALGLSYAEMAEHAGLSARTVERELVLARRELRARNAA